MRFGVTVFLTDYSIDPAELAREVEARGFISMYTPEHTHIPASRKTPPPMGEPLPKQYFHALDPFVALSFAAAATKSLRVGTGICLVAQHDPIVLAKEVATLDLLSGGRFDFGVGFGWNRDEMEHHGVPYARRREVVRERVLAMKELWTQEQGSFDGEFTSFTPSFSWPKPAQTPHPPVYIGGAGGPKLFGHVAEWADGWMPIGGRGIKASLPALAEEYEKVGRDPATMKVIPFGSLPDPGKLEYFGTLGIDEVVFGVEPGGRDVVLGVLDRFAERVEGFRG
ncbi:MAG: LLM class F420-dependent oxidoreductase [Actinomycetota bacterium]